MSAAAKPTRELSLFHRAAQLAVIDERIEQWMTEHPEDGGAIPDHLAAEWDAAMAGFEHAGEAEAEYIATQELAVANCDAEIARIRARQAVLTTRIERRRQHLRAWMVARGLDRIPSDTREIALRQSPPHVEIDGTAPTPMQLAVREDGALNFVRTVPARVEYDKRAMLAAWKAGERLPEGIRVAQDVRLVIK